MGWLTFCLVGRYVPGGESTSVESFFTTAGCSSTCSYLKLGFCGKHGMDNEDWASRALPYVTRRADKCSMQQMKQSGGSSFKSGSTWHSIMAERRKKDAADTSDKVMNDLIRSTANWASVLSWMPRANALGFCLGSFVVIHGGLC